MGEGVVVGFKARLGLGLGVGRVVGEGEGIFVGDNIIDEESVEVLVGFPLVGLEVAVATNSVMVAVGVSACRLLHAVRRKHISMKRNAIIGVRNLGIGEIVLIQEDAF